MLNRISLKVKIIIFIVAAVIGIASIAYDTRGNWTSMISGKTKAKDGNLVTKSVIVADEQKKTDTTKIEKVQAEQAISEKDKADKQKLLDDKQKSLEDQWQIGYTTYNKEKNYYQCINLMNDIIAKDDKFYKAYTLKGIAECYSSSANYDDGINNLNKALELKPDYGYGRFNKALAFELYGKYADSIEEYKSALEVEDYIWSYYGIASIYGRYGDAKNCVVYLNFAMQKDAGVIKSLVKDEHDFDNVRESKEFIEATNGAEKK